jgi:predicted kinase
MLIVMSGLPGTGKSALARAFGRGGAERDAELLRRLAEWPRE